MNPKPLLALLLLLHFQSCEGKAEPAIFVIVVAAGCIAVAFGLHLFYRWMNKEKN